MLQDLDASLSALLQAEWSLGKAVRVSFASPDEEFRVKGKLPAVSFFLYDIRENPDLRGGSWDQKRSEAGLVTRKRPPARVDCTYLITAWSPQGLADQAEDEHRMLGEVFKVLLRNREVPAQHLQGALVGQPVPTRLVAQNQLQSLGEFWQAMGGKPKATLHYGVTISVDVFAAVELGRAVTEKKTRVTIHQGVDRRRLRTDG